MCRSHLGHHAERRASSRPRRPAARRRSAGRGRAGRAGRRARAAPGGCRRGAAWRRPAAPCDSGTSVQVPGASATRCSSSPAISSASSSNGTSPARQARTHATNRVDRRAVRVAASAAGDMRARVRAVRGRCLGRSVGNGVSPAHGLPCVACMGRTCSPGTGAGARWCPRWTPSATWWSRTWTPASAARWSASSWARWCWRTGTAGGATSRWRRPRSCSTAQPVTLRRPPRPAPAQRRAAHRLRVGRRSPGYAAQVAKASRIWVEGIHDAALVERIWGDDLRIEGVVVEPLDGIDDLAAAVARVPARPAAPARRAGRPPGARLQGEPDRGRGDATRTCWSPAIRTSTSGRR